MRATPELGRRTIGSGSLWVFAVAASAPLTVIGGGAPVTFAVTGVPGVPVSFIVLMGALAFLTVGYVAMARALPHAATAYALLARLSPTVAVGGAAVAVLAYNAMEIGLFGLLGGQLAQALPHTQWWWWAAAGWLFIAVVGPRRMHLSVFLVTLLLVLELVAIVAMDLAGITHPAAGHLSLGPGSLGQLFVNGISGVGGVLTFSFAAFVGYELGPIFGEEMRGQRVSVARASFAALLFVGVFYAVSTWAMTMAVGPDQVVAASGASLTPDVHGVFPPPLPITILEGRYGLAVSWMAHGLFFTSMLGAMLSFHGSVARYLFALGRERVAPVWLATVTTGRHSGAPKAGSWTQSAIAAATIVVFAVLGLDPVTVLFAWLSAIGAIGVLVLLIGCSVAALKFFRMGGGEGGVSVWTRKVAPIIGISAGTIIFLIAVPNLDSLLSLEPGSPWGYLVVALIACAALAGMAWGRWLRRHRPEVYRGIAHGRPHPLRHPVPRLADVDV